MFSPCLLSKLLIFILLYYSCHIKGDIPNQIVFTKWVHDVEKQIHNLILNVTEENNVRQAYSDLSDVDVVEVNGLKLLGSVVEKVNIMLRKKEEALQRLVQAAETAANNHEEDLSLSLHQVPFFNVKSRDAADYMEPSDTFGLNVSLAQSGVHIPLEIYEGYPEILNGLKWSQVLDDIFTENLKNDPTLRWQYFGSSRGFMRIYPALSWGDNLNPADLYDARRRPWYTHTIAAPKDVIILIDKSGSVHGQTIDIMKIAVKSLIRTLSEEDYVNVAWFNNDVDWVVPCLDGLLPATTHNKRVLLDAVDRLHESNLTSYESALNFAYNAFERFEESREPWEGASCHKAIMFFSDGGTDWPQELSSHLCTNSSTDCTRIFTFGCGPHPIPTVVLKSMACRTRGFFSSITALGAIQNRIQDYIRILSRPLVLSGQSTLNLYHWSNIYVDKGGLGPVISVTLPVAGRFPDPREPQLLGVMGTDIPTELLVSQFPQSQLGTLGYAFGVSKNGFVAFHPQLHRHISLLQGEDPPNVDLLEAEGVGEKAPESFISLREALVEGRHDHMKLSPVVVPLSLGKAMVLRQHYYYAPLDTSPFRLGLVLPVGHSVIHPKKRLQVDLFSQRLNLSGSTIVSFPYCPTSGKAHNSVDDLQRLMTDGTGDCDRDWLQHLVWDATRLRHLSNTWRQRDSLPEDTLFHFVATVGGLTITNPASEVARFTKENDIHESSHYKRALARRSCVLTPETMEGPGLRSVTVACSVDVDKSGRYATVAVVGAAVEQTRLQAIFNRNMGESCFGVDATLHCYLIDDNGFVVATSRLDIEAGTFLGEVDPQVTEDLVQSGMFLLQDRYNFQGYCLRGTTEATQASSHLTPTLHSVYSLIWHFVANLGELLSSLRLLFFSLASLHSASLSEAFFGWELVRRNYSCITKTSWIAAAPASDGAQPADVAGQQMVRQLQCGDCVREMRVAQLPLLAATLLVVDLPCDCPDTPPPMLVSPQEDFGPDFCQTQKLVRQPNDRCVSFSVEERNTSCYIGDKSGASAHKFVTNFSAAQVVLFSVWLGFRSPKFPGV